MIELGKIQPLIVQREKEFGVYLGEKKDDKNSVLLPKKQVPEGTKVGDSLEVFVYKDSQDRLIATTNRPKLQVGETDSQGRGKDRSIPRYGTGKRSAASV